MGSFAPSFLSSVSSLPTLYPLPDQTLPYLAREEFRRSHVVQKHAAAGSIAQELTTHTEHK